MRAQRWEYMALESDMAGFFVTPHLDGDALTAKLNELGAEGWELVSIASLEAGRGRTAHIALILKRPLD